MPLPFFQLNKPNWNQAPEIISLSSTNKNDLIHQLLSLKGQFGVNPATMDTGLLCEKFRDSFHSKGP
jgi:hypothetical protein